MQSIAPRHDKPAAIRIDLGAIFVSYHRPYALTAVTQLRCVIDWMR